MTVCGQNIKEKYQNDCHFKTYILDDHMLGSYLHQI